MYVSFDIVSIDYLHFYHHHTFIIIISHPLINLVYVFPFFVFILFTMLYYYYSLCVLFVNECDDVFHKRKISILYLTLMTSVYEH